jgi:hypothetical protein
MSDNYVPTLLSTTTTSAAAPHFSPIFIRAIFLLLGVGILIPWNAFVSAKPYFQARLCRDETVIVDFELWFGLVWNTSSVIALGLIIASVAIRDFWCRRPTRNETSNILERSDHGSTGSGGVESQTSSLSDSTGHSTWLVMVPLALYLVVFLLTDLMVLVPSIEPRLFLRLTLVSLAICGTCGAIATAGIISTAGLFESHLGITPFFSGQALGGVAVSMANFIAATLESPQAFWEETCQTTPSHSQTYNEWQDSAIGTSVVDRHLTSSNTNNLWQGPTSCSPYHQLDWAVFGYFLVGCVVLACCLVGYAVIHRYQQQQHRDNYQAVQDVPVMVPQQPSAVDALLEDQSPRIGLEMKSQHSTDLAEDHGTTAEIMSTPSYHGDTTQRPMTPTLLQNNENMISESFADEESVEPEEYTEEENELAVFSAIQGPWTSIFLVFTLTLCLFPSWVSQLRSVHQCQSHNRLFNDLYTPLSFVIFNVGDLCGRLLSEHVPVTQIRHLSSKLVGSALCRLLIFPLLFLLCVTEDSRAWFPVIRSDGYSWVVQFFFALTNGLLVSTSFMHAPHLVAHNTSMQERASEMMTFSVSFGLLMGSLLSFPFANLASLL